MSTMSMGSLPQAAGGPLAANAADGERLESGVYCSTSGTVLTDRESLSEHYKSDFHRYNLKRKVAGLPPVTREWFDARRAQLASSQATSGSHAVPSGHVQVWFDPLLRKTFRTEQTYLAHTRSNKFLEAVRKSGEAAPPPVISLRKVSEAEGQQGASKPQGNQGFNVVLPSGGLPLKTEDNGTRAEAGDVDEDSGWETASDDDLPDVAEEGEEQPWEEWDVCRSLFDNHMSKSFDDNLEYMWRTYGFYLPDAEYLKDPEGLVKYLGAKLQQGRVPIYCRGDDPNAKQFRSLHAVQRHMVDSGRTKMVYEDNEEEYEEFYDYGEEEGEEEGKEVAVAGGPGTAPALTATGYELVVPGTGSAGGKVLGTREFAKYYRQRHKPSDDRQIVLVNIMLAKYRALGISLRDESASIETKKLKSKNKTDQKWEGKRAQGLYMRTNINNNLPKNVPY